MEGVVVALGNFEHTILVSVLWRWSRTGWTRRVGPVEMPVQAGPGGGARYDEYSQASKLHPERVRHGGNDEESCDRGDHLHE